ncbi:MAG: hypothetical protein VX641_00865 [Planctomycetota bacterium]|nr:hypothetical protein [Planctomycetota bacterium]
MSGADDLVMDAVAMGAQMLYFKMKNNHRAKALKAVSAEHGLSFCQKAAEYHGEIDRLDLSEHLTDEQQTNRSLSTKAKLAHRFFGESQLQTKLWSFNTNRWRGDWQTNCNIMEGTWKNHLMTSFDTLFFNTDGEGEYTSVFAHCTAGVPRMIMSPAGLLSGMKRVDENQILNRGYHKVSFESGDFNKRYRVVAADEKLAYAFISQAMIEFLMDHTKEKWHIELAPGGILISTICTLAPRHIMEAMDFLAGFLDHVDQDLLEA